MTPGAGHAVCQVCGVEIRAAPKLCPRCETPHHADCWEYTGKCSTYACGETAGAAPVAVVEVDGALVASAARVAAIVPVADPAVDGRCWVADPGAAWHGGREARAKATADERVVMLPRHVLPDLRIAGAPRKDSGRTSALLLLASAFFLSVAMSAGGIGAALAVVLVGFGVSGLVVALPGERPLEKLPPGGTAWLVRSPKGTRLRGLDGAERVWDLAVPPEAGPRRLRLERSYDVVPGEGDTTALTYRLALWWADGAGTLTTRLPLTQPVQIPAEPEARRTALERLVAQRALGQHIAALLEVPFEEGVPR